MLCIPDVAADFLGHIAEHGEDRKARDNRRTWVETGKNKSPFKWVKGELIVRAKRGLRTKADGVAEEDLRSGVFPDLKKGCLKAFFRRNSRQG